MLNYQKEIFIENKKLMVFDNVFSICEREELFNFSKNLTYKPVSQTTTDCNLDLFTRNLMLEDVKPVGFFVNNILDLINKFFFGKFEIIRFKSNAWTMGSKTLIHGDMLNAGNLSVLYHTNFYWKDSWGGENNFYNKDCSDIEKSILYVPGRIIIFDSTIPHSVRTITKGKIRFSFAMLLKNNGNISSN